LPERDSIAGAAILRGAIFGFLAVAAGAFGAHALKAHLSDYALGVWNTAVQYQMYHALALLCLAGISKHVSRRFTGEAALTCFTFGIIIFSGSLYALALTGVKWLGAITPIGGALFLIGWLALARTALVPAPSYE
jgi:uncharacterized membrane protein YgdD (TMEM256/DUF423 family)